MTPRIIDDHAIQAREQHIIDTTILLIEKHGIENLTMDKVVAAVPYSKGTIYKHFLGKEDLFLAIGNQAIRIMSELFGRAAQHNGCTRERMLLVNISYLIYAILHPTLFKTVQCAKSPSVYGKSSEQRLLEQEQLENNLMGIFTGIIQDAEIDNDFVIPKHMNLQQVCFSTWAMGYGSISLLSSEVDQCGGSSGLIVERELFNQNNLLFDGYKWTPLTEDKDYKSALVAALQRVFPQELAMMSAMGRELNFNDVDM